MKNCPFCGAQLTDDAGFCTSCGKQQPAPQVQCANVNVYAAPASRESTWDGGVFETFVNTLAASLIITFTCGFGTPWAICYVMRYIASHAMIDGKHLRFDGTGGQLFGQWIKWFLLTIVTCGIYSFWVMPRLYKWVCSHLHAE